MDLIKEKRQRFLVNLIQEAVINIVAEQEMASSVPPATPQPDPRTNTQDPSVQQPQQPQQNQQQEVFDVDQMIDKLNVLRGGKSFSDPEVYGKLTTFFKSLTEEQKSSLDYLLSELGKIIFDSLESEAGINKQQPAPTSTPPQNNPPAPPPTAPTSPGI